MSEHKETPLVNENCLVLEYSDHSSEEDNKSQDLKKEINMQNNYYKVQSQINQKQISPLSKHQDKSPKSKNNGSASRKLSSLSNNNEGKSGRKAKLERKLSERKIFQRSNACMNRQSRSVDHQNIAYEQLTDSNNEDVCALSGDGGMDTYNIDGSNEFNFEGSNGTQNEKSKSYNRRLKIRTNGKWTEQEHKKFLEALKLYGKDWYKVQAYIGTRTSAQTRSHAQKYFSKLFKEGKMNELAMYDNLLSRRAKPDDDVDMTDQSNASPIMKTKTITKNYGTRFANPFKTKENDKDLFIVETVKKSALTGSSNNNTADIFQIQAPIKKEDESAFRNVQFFTEVVRYNNKSVLVQNANTLSANSSVLQEASKSQMPLPQKLFEVTKVDPNTRSNSDNEQGLSGHQEKPQEQFWKASLLSNSDNDNLDESELQHFFKNQQQNLAKAFIQPNLQIPIQLQSKTPSKLQESLNRETPNFAEFQDQVDNLAQNMSRWSIQGPQDEGKRNSYQIMDTDPKSLGHNSISQFLLNGNAQQMINHERDSRGSDFMSMLIDGTQRVQQDIGMNLRGSFENIMSGQNFMDFRERRLDLNNQNRLGIMVSGELLIDDQIMKIEEDLLNMNANNNGQYNTIQQEEDQYTIHNLDTSQANFIDNFYSLQ